MNSDEATVVNLSLHQRVLFASRRFPSTADSLAAAERTKTPRGTRRFQNQALGLQLWKPLKIEVFTHQLAFGFGDRAAVVPLQARSHLLRLSISVNGVSVYPPVMRRGMAPQSALPSKCPACQNHLRPE